MNPRSAALRAATQASPDDQVLRVMLAESLEQEGAELEALEEYGVLLGAGGPSGAEALHAAGLAVRCQRADLARGLLERARQAGVVEGLVEVEVALGQLLRSRGLVTVAAEPEADGPRWVVEPTTITFADVGGLADVKKVLHRMVVLPLSRPDLYARYGRRSGGGVMLYGPPGCGKTLLARGLAGECGLPFLVVRIEDVVAPLFGQAERNLHDAFEAARAAAPCVLFLDELDALAYPRSRSGGDVARRLADVLLQELDSIGSDNEGILVLAATNAPWDVDDAAQRPGRFDRRVFVPPPDAAARELVLQVLLREVHASGVDHRRLADTTALFSGADLRAVVERAVDEVIETALETGTEPPLTQPHLERAVAGLRPSTLDWLQRARDHVEFAGSSERYADVADFLRGKDVRRRLGGY